jgi:hypothetical protein
MLSGLQLSWICMTFIDGIEDPPGRNAAELRLFGEAC